MNFANVRESSSSEIQIATKNFLCISLCISPVFCVRAKCLSVSALLNCQLTESFAGGGLCVKVLL